jgi:hypothetical protein
VTTAGEKNMKAFKVKLDGQEIDKIFYSNGENIEADEVKRSLINHDGYDSRIVVVKERSKIKAPYQPKTGQLCSCKPGIQRDNCPRCEGTGQCVDFAAIRARTLTNA